MALYKLTLLYSFYGTLSGFLFHRVFCYFIKRKSSGNVSDNLTKKRRILVLYVTNSIAIFALIALLGMEGLPAYQAMVFSGICMCIAMIDLWIHKIPNLLLLTLIGIKSIFLILSADFAFFPKGLLGLIVGFAIFMLPSILKIPIGAGDIKYAAAAGFCLGTFNLLQLMVIMTVLLLIFLAFLLVTKKGNMKSTIPMGPFISAGFILTMLFPIS